MPDKKLKSEEPAVNAEEESLDFISWTDIVRWHDRMKYLQELFEAIRSGKNHRDLLSLSTSGFTTEMFSLDVALCRFPIDMRESFCNLTDISGGLRGLTSREHVVTSLQRMRVSQALLKTRMIRMCADFALCSFPLSFSNCNSLNYQKYRLDLLLDMLPLPRSKKPDP